MSDVPEGYKMSEVGVIPEEWEVKTLGEKTTKIGSGITPTGGEKVYKSEGRPFLRSQNVGWGNLILDDIAFIDDKIHNTFKATEIEKNDVFLNITGASIGRSAIADERVESGNVNQHVCIIRTIEDELNPNFLNYFLLSKKGQKQIDSFQAGGNRQGLNFGQIKSFQIPLPPLHEQQAIASALSDVDALIAALEQLITKKRNIKQGAMQQLLTGKKRLPGFSGEWEVKKLGEYSEFHKGKGLPKSEITTNGKYKCIHYGELFTTYNEEIKEVFSRTDKKDNFFLSRANDVLMPTSDVTPNGLATASCIKENEVILGGDVLVIRALADVLDGLFLSYSITQNKKQIMQLVSGSTVYHLYGSDMKKYQFNIPPTKEEQQAIAQILSDMDTGIESLEQKRDKYKAIKQGMMQELLTGKRRLA